MIFSDIVSIFDRVLLFIEFVGRIHPAIHQRDQSTTPEDGPVMARLDIAIRNGDVDQRVIDKAQYKP